MIMELVGSHNGTILKYTTQEEIRRTDLILSIYLNLNRHITWE